MARNMRITHKPPIAGISLRNTPQLTSKTAKINKTMFLFGLPMEGVLYIYEYDKKDRQ
jgi:hypothetical protein